MPFGDPYLHWPYGDSEGRLTSLYIEAKSKRFFDEAIMRKNDSGF